MSNLPPDLEAEVQAALTLSKQCRDMAGNTAGALDAQVDALLAAARAAHGMIQDLNDKVQEFPRRLREVLAAHEAGLQQQAAEVNAGLVTAGGRLEEIIRSGRGEMEELLDSHLGALNDAVDAVVEDVGEQVADLFEKLQDLRTESEELGQELLAQSLPDGVSEGTEKFFSGLGTLNRMGSSGLGKITGSVRSIQEKTRVLTDAVEEVKPVLDLARQLL